jgi:acyl carrier protein
VGSQPDPKLSEEAAAKLRAALAEAFGFDGLPSPERPLQEVDGWDSMSAVNFTLELETTFGVDLAGVILSGEQTLADVIRLLADKGAVL